MRYFNLYIQPTLASPVPSALRTRPTGVSSDATVLWLNEEKNQRRTWRRRLSHKK